MRTRKAKGGKNQIGHVPSQNHFSSGIRKTAKFSTAWIPELAGPYLKGYRPAEARERGLQGCWFLGDPASGEKYPAEVAFFVGYLVEPARKYHFLNPDPPECVVFAWVNPENARLRENLVRQPGSLVRKTFEYIRWLTHRPPRFVFHEGEGPAMARHTSMRSWPRTKYEHFSRNFFIETLAWLVRSGLVRKLREEAAVFEPRRPVPSRKQVSRHST